MSEPVDRTGWKHIYPHALSRKYEDLSGKYFKKFGEHLDFTMFPEDATFEKFEVDVLAAIETGTEIISYYCPSCQNHENGIEYTYENPCNLCGFPADE
ncbi:MAG: hypothetical protein FWC70_08140 [Defluviitaleaceae bacterium]|nr:hypothetical protein [Defluviitaleaceae bacterium]